MNDEPKDLSGPLAQVFESADLAVLPVIKSVLEAAGIPFVVQGETTLGLIPIDQPVANRNEPLLRAILLVPAEEEEHARAVIEAYSLSPDEDEEP